MWLCPVQNLPEVLIICLDRVPFIDTTGIQAFEDILASLRKRRVLVMQCGANPRVIANLRAARVFSGGSDTAYCESLRDALLRAGVSAMGSQHPDQPSSLSQL
jgi:sulfate permease, SulP family